MSKTWLPLRKRSSALLFAALAPLFAEAQPNVGVEKSISSPDVEVLSRTDEIDVASSGDTILVVSTDQRTDRGSDIVAMRLDRTTTLLEPIVITSTPGVSESGPLVVFDGSRFVVVWEAEGSVVAAEVDRAGQVSIEPVVIGPGKPESLMVISGQTLISIVDSTGSTIYRMRDDLRLVDIEDFPRRSNLRITRLGNGLLIVWPENEFPSGRAVLRVLRMDNRGRIVDNSIAAVLGNFDRDPSFAIATVGEEAILVVAAPDRFVVGRVAVNGTITVIHADEANQERTIEDIVPRFDGFDLLMIIADRPRIVRFTGNALTTESTPIAGLVADAAGTPQAGRTFTVWQSEGIITGRYAFAGSTEPPITISRAPASQQLPALATDGGNVLAVWSEDLDHDTDRIAARLLTRDGTPVGSGRPLNLGTRTMTPSVSAPAVAFAAGNYHALWTDQRRGFDKPANLTMRTVDPSGIAGADTTVSTTAHPTESPALASEGNNALIVWTERPLTGSQVRAALVLSPSQKTDIPGTVGEAAVTWGNSSYLVVGNTALGGIRGTFVSRNGAVERIAFETAGTTDGEASVAWNGRSHYLVVFRRGTSVYGRMLDRNGTTIGDNFPIELDTFAENPRVAWDGHSFVVAWTARAIPATDTDGDVFITRIRTTGEIDTNAVLSATQRNDDYPFLLGLGGGQTLAAYQRMAGEFLFVHRVYTKVVTTPPLTVRRRSVR
jgi:hypothetical protein